VTSANSLGNLLRTIFDLLAEGDHLEFHAFETILQGYDAVVGLFLLCESGVTLFTFGHLKVTLLFMANGVLAQELF